MTKLKKYSVVLLFLLSLLFLFANINERVPHYDEAGNFIHTKQTTYKGYYDYQAEHFHGPLYFYLLKISDLIFNGGLYGIRITTAYVSAIILLLSLTYFKSSWFSFLFLAISPAFIFYGKYAIHEPLFILLQLLTIIGIKYILTGREKLGCYIVIVSVALMISTKETWIIYCGSLFLALLTNIFRFKKFS